MRLDYFSYTLNLKNYTDVVDDANYVEGVKAEYTKKFQQVIRWKS